MGEKDDLVLSEEREGGKDLISLENTNNGILNTILRFLKPQPIDTLIDKTKRMTMLNTAKAAINVAITPESVLETFLPQAIKHIEKVKLNIPDTFILADEMDKADYIERRLNILYNHPVIIEDWEPGETKKVSEVAINAEKTWKQLEGYGVTHISGIAISDLFKQMISRNIKWEKIGNYSKIDNTVWKDIVRYAPTQDLSSILNNYSEITPSILAKTIHLHEGFDILPYLQSYFSNFPEKLSSCYCNPAIIIHYPTDGLCEAAIEYIEDTQLSLFRYNVEEGGTCGYKTLIEIIFHHSNSIREETRGKAKKLLLEHIQENYLTMFSTIPDEHKPKKMIDVSYRDMFLQLQEYCNDRQGGKSVKVPELKEAFSKFVNEYDISRRLDEIDQNIISFLEDIS